MFRAKVNRRTKEKRISEQLSLVLTCYTIGETDLDPETAGDTTIRQIWSVREVWNINP